MLGPYLGIAAVLILIWLLIAFRKMATPAEQSQEEEGVQQRGARAASGATATTATASPRSSSTSPRRSARGRSRSSTRRTSSASPTEDSGWYLQASLILFLVSRFVMTYLLGIFRPTMLLFVMGALGVVFCLIAMFSENMVGLIAVVAISLSLSLMFPTIYGVALRGLGEDTKFGAAGLVMAILGGALMPLIHGKVMDEVGRGAGLRRARGLPGARRRCYALFDLRTNRGGRRRSSSRARTDAGRGAPSRSRVAAALGLGVVACGDDEEQVTVGLITKQDDEPVLGQDARDVAEKTAGDENVELLTAAGQERRRQRQPGGGARGHDRGAARRAS